MRHLGAAPVRIGELMYAASTAHLEIFEKFPMGAHHYYLREDSVLIFLGANEAADAILGVEHQKRVGQSIEKAFPPLIGTEIPDRYREVALTGVPWQTERVEYRDNEIVGAFEVFVFQPAPNHVTALFLEIGERKREEGKRDENARYLGALSEIVQLLVAQPDAAGLQTFLALIGEASRATCAVLAMAAPPRQSRAKTWEMLEWASPTRVAAKAAHDSRLSHICEAWIEEWKQMQSDLGSASHQAEYSDVFAEGPEGFRLLLPIHTSGEFIGFLAMQRSTEAGRWNHALLDFLRVAAQNLSRAILRARAEAALIEREDRYRSILQEMSDMVWLVDENIIVRYVTPSCKRILGYEPEALIGTSGLSLVHPDDAALTTAAFKEVAAESNPHTPTEFRFHHADGSWVTLEAVGTNLLGHPNVRGIVLTTRDVTERKKYERDLLDSEERFRSLIENSLDVVLVLSSEGTIDYVSPSVERIMGYVPAESLGRNLLEFLHPDDLHSALETIERTFRGDGTPQSLICRIRHGDGTWRTIEAMGKQTHDAYGAAKLIVNYRDVTTRIQAEEERAQLEAQLRQAQKLEAVGQLAGGVAHDFNNLLTAIQGYTELAKEDLPADHAVQSSLDEVSNATRRAVGLVRQLLLFSRREEPRFQNVDLNEVVLGVAKMLRRVIGEHIDLRIEPGVDSLAVYADPGQLQQILMNLCVNARDAMPDGGAITIRTSRVGLDAAFCREQTWAREGSFVLLDVVDTGTGISPQDLERIFDPFFTTKAVGHGTGLGLATVYGITQRHDGFVHVDSVLGQGTAFHIYLPWSGVDPDLIEEEKLERALRGNGQVILLAEDEPQVRRLAVRMLEASNYRVIQAHDGVEALAAFDAHAHEIAACILDVIMPGMSGGQVREQIHAKFPRMPILHISGHDFDLLDHSLPSGEETPLLRKPFTSVQLLSSLRELLGG
ncbi:MAG: PAS domain S-box protein [Candidatus Hydrogenedentes bacterium]|nr:PAS domain S-box protein [Candidatus Hydrogenedentota bacterium]